MKIKAVGIRCKGQGREKNEDYFDFFPHAEGISPATNIYVVADGMGGGVSGEIASKKVVETVIDCFSANLPVGNEFTLESKNPVCRRLEYAIQKANNKLRLLISNNPELEGMGTTIVTSHFEKGKVFLGHVGDSRCYRIRNGRITCLTKDHSLVQHLYETGKISLEEMRCHPKKNVITRALGVGPNPECELSVESVEERDIFLLCTDGLIDLVSDDEMLSILKCGEDINAEGERLIKLASSRGGNDDMTAVVIQVVNLEEKSNRPGQLGVF